MGGEATDTRDFHWSSTRSFRVSKTAWAMGQEFLRRRIGGFLKYNPHATEIPAEQFAEHLHQPEDMGASSLHVLLRARRHPKS